MGLLARKIRDDRGVVREVYGTGYGLETRTDEGSVSDEALVRLRHRIRVVRANRRRTKGSPSVGRLALFICAAVPIYLVGSLAAVVFYAAGPVIWVLSVLTGGMAFGVYRAITRRGLGRASPQLLRDVLLMERRCPFCAYELSFRRVSEDDGCVECAECGGAWKLPRGDEQREGG